jgi:hypothetical protein
VFDDNPEIVYALAVPLAVAPLATGLMLGVYPAIVPDGAVKRMVKEDAAELT